MRRGRGELANNLTDGDTVAESWIDSVSDWWVDNHPVVVGPGTAAAWNGGNIRWDLSPHNIDHLWGHGSVSADLSPGSRDACSGVGPRADGDGRGDYDDNT